MQSMPAPDARPHYIEIKPANHSPRWGGMLPLFVLFSASSQGFPFSFHILATCLQKHLGFWIWEEVNRTSLSGGRTSYAPAPSHQSLLPGLAFRVLRRQGLVGTVLSDSCIQGPRGRFLCFLFTRQPQGSAPEFGILADVKVNTRIGVSSDGSWSQTLALRAPSAEITPTLVLRVSTQDNLGLFGAAIPGVYCQSPKPPLVRGLQRPLVPRDLQFHEYLGQDLFCLGFKGREIF